MDLLTIIILAIGLSMDAFAVSICKGLAIKKLRFADALIVGIWFGGFQALMPFLGYILGIQFEKLIKTVAPIVAFLLLAVIGINMLREAIFEKDEEEETDSLNPKEMLLMAIATSIDAMAVGISFACVPVEIMADAGGIENTLLACGIIGIITCILSMTGVKVGNVFGTKYEKKAEVAGGIILILLGIRMLF